MNIVNKILFCMIMGISLNTFSMEDDNFFNNLKREWKDLKSRETKRRRLVADSIFDQMEEVQRTELHTRMMEEFDAMERQNNN